MSTAINSNEKLGLWSGMRLNSFWSWLVALMLAMGSIRGLLVIHFDAPPAILYSLTAGTLLALSVYGWIKRGWCKLPELVRLKNLMKLNLLLGGVNVAVDLTLGVPFDLSVLYIYLAPFVVFIFMRVPTHYFNVVIVVVTLATCGSVMDNFYEALRGPDGWASAIAYNTKLYPDVENSVGKGRTGNSEGDYYRASGYTGSPHDSANILGMVISFFFIRFILRKSLLDLGLFLLGFLSMTMTQSASNIIAALLTLIIFLGYNLIRNGNRSIYIFLLLSTVGLMAMGAIFGDVISIFLARLSFETGDWGGMVSQLDGALTPSSILFVLVGHAAAFQSSVINTEIAYIKSLFQLGVIHTVILFWIMLYPVFMFAKTRAYSIDAQPPAAAIVFGFISLLHYGSVFKVTSVFLFYMFFSICLNNTIRAKEYETLTN